MEVQQQPEAVESEHREQRDDDDEAANTNRRAKLHQAQQQVLALVIVSLIIIIITFFAKNLVVPIIAAIIIASGVAGVAGDAQEEIIYLAGRPSLRAPAQAPHASEPRAPEAVRRLRVDLRNPAAPEQLHKQPQPLCVAERESGLW